MSSVNDLIKILELTKKPKEEISEYEIILSIFCIYDEEKEIYHRVLPSMIDIYFEYVDEPIINTLTNHNEKTIMFVRKMKKCDIKE